MKKWIAMGAACIGVVCLVPLGLQTWAQEENEAAPSPPPQRAAGLHREATDAAPPMPGPGDMAKMDADKDGNVTLTEFLAPARERFKRLDANEDGVLTEEEWPKRPPRGRMGPGLDANDDGMITYEEAVAANPDLTTDQFKARDSNGDGVWTPEDHGGHGRGRGRGGYGRGGGRGGGMGRGMRGRGMGQGGRRR